MNRFIAMTTAVILIVVSLAVPAAATNLDPDTPRPIISRSTPPLGDDGGWVVPPIRDDGHGTGPVAGTIIGWVSQLSEYLITNYFLDIIGEVENGTNSNEPIDARRPVDQR